MRAVTEVGAEAGVVIIQADTHVGTEAAKEIETVISTAVAVVAHDRARARPTATTDLMTRVGTATMTATSVARMTIAARVVLLPALAMHLHPH